PLGVFAVAIATVILPNLSRHHAASSAEAYSQTLDWALRIVLLIAVPAAAALMLLAEPILASLFLYGDVMTPRDMSMATYSLRAYSLGLIAFMLIKVLAPGFFARQNMRTPVRIGVIAMVLNMFLNLLFVVPLHHYWQIGHVGLALATSISAFLNAGLLFYALRKKAIYAPGRSWLRFMINLTAAVAVMLAVLILAAGQFDALDAAVWQQLSWWQRSGGITLICSAGFAVYIAVLWLGGMRPADLRGPAKATSREH
ncbi:MAG: polysaccharide biosynthesis C-terminal domain-containing protein, partial [Oceanospirillaceae bacterium]|nr:polysaccharide biosynthesis C-terminal domain-containing protein [Oceanospirillaceae bacterium]